MSNVIDFNSAKAERQKPTSPVADEITLECIRNIITTYKSINIDLTIPSVRKEVMVLGMVLNGLTHKINGNETVSSDYLDQVLVLFDAVQEKERG